MENDSFWRRADRYIRRKLVWNRLYRITSYLRSALWVVPLIAIVLVLVTVPALRWLDGVLRWRISGLTVTGAESLLQSVVTLTLSFVVFTFSSMLVAIQIASGQLTPRIIATTLLRDNVVRYSVGLFVYSLVFAIMGLNRLERVNELLTVACGLLGIASMATFLFLIDHAARLLRPVSILAHVGDRGLAVVRTVYPATVSDEADATGPWVPPADGPRRLVRHSGTSSHVLAVDFGTLVAEARRRKGIVELVPRVGDFVAYDEPLFVLYGGATAITGRVLRGTVAFGEERTMEQDPLFAFRIITDIGLKALSRAINDPTTAVLAIDQLHRLLKAVGKRQLRGETITDERGAVRVVHRTPNWEDFVHIATREIRACGADSIQVVRRQRAMLDGLIASLPEHRHPALEQERQLLDRTIDAVYSLEGDRALARVPDPQGLGGSPVVRGGPDGP